MLNRIVSMYFSATNTTKKIVSAIESGFRDNYEGELKQQIIDFTLPKAREEAVAFREDDIVIFGVPVYAGRVPNVLLKYLATIKGNGALVIPVVVYGNRNYDDALIELKDILEQNGFKAVAAGAFIGEHSFSKILAKGRPDHNDLTKASVFGKEIAIKLIKSDILDSISVKGNRPYRNYYMPKDEVGNPVDIRKVKPKTNDNCIDCKLCVNVCPMGSIDHDDVSQFNGICIKCGSCIKKCPVEAKYYDDHGYLRHKEELEVGCVERREPDIFI